MLARELETLARAVVASVRVVTRRPPSAAAWPLERPEPPDLAALYALSDGLELVDGTRILPRGELAEATRWLIEDRSLAWDADLFVIGERADMAVVRDLDSGATRAGGGVLEAPHDALESFRRVALGAVGYLAARAGLVDPEPTPELLLARAVAGRDVDALASALARPAYPGHERELALGALALGGALAARGDTARALLAFERSVSERVRGVGRAAATAEASAAWRACAVAAKGTPAAEECQRRAKG